MNSNDLVKGEYYWVITNTSVEEGRIIETEYKSFKFCVLKKSVRINRTLYINNSPKYEHHFYSTDGTENVINDREICFNVFKHKDDYLVSIVKILGIDISCVDGYENDFISIKIKESQNKNPEKWI